MRTRNVFLTAALAASITGAGAARPIEQEGEKLVEKMAWVGAEMRFAGRTVQGAPYSAHAVTEFTQTLPDGNRIVRKSTTLLYRDSEGRTRREPQSDGTRAYFHASPEAAVAGGKLHVGPVPSIGMAGMMKPEFVVITDPVAAAEHVLDAKNRTAQSRKVSLQPEKSALMEKVRGKMETARWKSARDGTRTESLGREVVDGIDAEGTRTITTIAAGEIGNERPIEIVSERWFSPELQIVVRSRHSDPRSGETVYRLTNLSRAEPQRSLFEVPSDYTVRQSPAYKMRGPR